MTSDERKCLQSIAKGKKEQYQPDVIASLERQGLIEMDGYWNAPFNLDYTTNIYQLTEKGREVLGMRWYDRGWEWIRENQRQLEVIASLLLVVIAVIECD